MFLQEIISKKINDDDDLDMDDDYTTALGLSHTKAKRTMGKTKNMVGSIKSGAINFPKDQKLFHASDVSEKAKQAAIHIKSEIDKDLFNLKKPKWNASVLKSGLPAYDNDYNNLFAIKKGFKDFAPLPPKDPKVYEGTDTRNQYHTGWNVSNQVPIPLHKQKSIAEETAMRVAKTKETNERLVTNYKSPFEQAKEHSKMLATQRAELSDMKNTLRDRDDCDQI